MSDIDTWKEAEYKRKVVACEIYIAELERKMHCIDLNELKKLCQEYDKENGEYPESEYQGFAIYYYACDKQNICARDEESFNDYMEGVKTGETK